MKRDEFIKELAELLEIEDKNLDEETKLNSLKEYDSLSTMAILAFIDENFNKQLKTVQLRQAVTIKNLMELIGLENFK